jgi:hypothetical protein
MRNPSQSEEGSNPEDSHIHTRRRENVKSHESKWSIKPLVRKDFLAALESRTKHGRYLRRISARHEAMMVWLVRKGH